ncbi:membrane protein [Pseudomonas chlororaphis]|uniref:Membrane protein n=1 Tax=Pseudomonas chlororaphis TaxID=587753 RepID=A0A0D5XZ17_9PSED|nr:membrane protein [Pseudomonas chlororaphis]AKA24055.1 membrane protein [Pseudomonas chlororaphis]
MLYPLLLTLHLFAALVFIGTVFFEVLFLQHIRQQLPARLRVLLEQGIARRARRLMPWVLLVLFGAGLGMLWLRYLPLLAVPLASSFGTLLLLKILLAASVLGHFLVAMLLFRSGRMNARYSHAIHASLFGHMVLIVLLAKGMFYLSW